MMMAPLDDFLDKARRADRLDRISWRNPIATHGQPAIPAMVRWVVDPKLGAFAVRVLEKIAEQPSDRAAVVTALDSIDISMTTAAIARDVTAALDRLGHRGHRTAGSGVATTPADWRGYAAASPLEKRFHDDMLDIFRLAGEATRQLRSDGTYVRGYWATYFLRGVRNHGGLAYAHQLLQADGTTAGFERLTEEGRLDLTMEALVLRSKYRTLFPQHEIQVASSRLARAGYQQRPRA